MQEMGGSHSSFGKLLCPCSQTLGPRLRQGLDQSRPFGTHHGTVFAEEQPALWCPTLGASGLLPRRPGSAALHSLEPRTHILCFSNFPYLKREKLTKICLGNFFFYISKATDTLWTMYQEPLNITCRVRSLSQRPISQVTEFIFLMKCLLNRARESKHMWQLC